MKLFTKASIILLTLSMIGCQSSKPDNVPPVEVLFEHANINKEYRVDVTIEEPNTYRVAINYYLTKPEEYKLFSSKKVTAKDIEDSDKLREILGLKDENILEDTGVPASYKVKIYDNQKGRYIVNETIDNPEINSVSSGRSVTLATAYLVEGQYAVYITYLGGSIGLNSLYTKAVIRRNHHGK